MRNRKFIEFLDRVMDHIKGFVLALIAVIAVLGVVVGYRYYRYTQDDPAFCTSCHMMKEAVAEWERGKHRDIVCQKCHHLNLLEQNQLLVSFVLKNPGPFSQSHGRNKPWLECKNCHIDEIAQGSVTLRKSYGHAKHVFMLNTTCKVCHGGSLHRFRPNEKACQECHKDKGVHGVGMEAFSCLKCHSFSEKSVQMVSNEKCRRCHKVPTVGPMSTFPCHRCHKPHGKIKLTSTDCLGECHGSETKIGQHDRHMKKGMQCLDCHKAHRWVVGRTEAKGLCNRCHPNRDPKTFVY
ncbi:MAG TPA: cytochrome c oxidase assembly protein COX14 [Thermodesulfovibrionales bacterium]|nr:cytochrome c oxidase assembly protein COX14 [Thermodesulfovibrionales bacterium]